MASSHDRQRLNSVPPVDEIEATLSRIQGVTAVRVVQGPAGPAEVHVLAAGGRTPKQLVRDIQSVAAARFGMEIDYRKVSVVQLEEGSERAATRSYASRPAVLRVATTSEGHTTTAEIVLRVQDKSVSGVARGPSTAGMGLMANAVLEALQSMGRAIPAKVAAVQVMSASNYGIAVVVLEIATPRGMDHISGSAIVRTNPNDAVARATLSALNRILETT